MIIDQYTCIICKVQDVKNMFETIKNALENYYICIAKPAKMYFETCKNIFQNLQKHILKTSKN